MKEKFNLEDNEPCWCCSGKLYKDCCKEKIKITNDEKTYKMYMSEFDKAHRNYKKICMHPNQSECSSIKTHAHTISQKAVLELIAENKHVLMPIEFGISRTLKMHPMPIEAKATKFYCFCSKHDGMFSPIDKQNVDFTEYNCFLYAYRIFSSTYYKIERELACHYKLREKYDLTCNPFALVTYIGMERNLNLLDTWKEKFDNAIINESYGILENIRIDLNYRVYFAVATCFCPMFDVYGNDLPWNAESLPLVYISVIPDQNYTRILFSWFKENNEQYSYLKKQINEAPTRLILKYLNNLLPLNCENMTVSPKVWDAWGEKGRNEFLKIASEHLWINEKMKYCSETYFRERGFNLFMKI